MKKHKEMLGTLKTFQQFNHSCFGALSFQFQIVCLKSVHKPENG